MAATDYDFNRTRDQIIKRAFRLIGITTAEDNTLTGEQLEQGKEALDTLVKDWQAKGIYLWTNEVQSITTVAGTATYTLGNDVLAVDRAYYVSSNQDNPVEIITFREYQDITDKQTQAATPTYVAFDFQLAAPVMYVYAVPNTAYTIKLFVVKKLKDFDTSSTNPDFPQRFLRALTWSLAVDLGEEYGIPIDRLTALGRKASFLFTEAKNFNQELKENDFIEPNNLY